MGKFFDLKEQFNNSHLGQLYRSGDVVEAFKQLHIPGSDAMKTEMGFGLDPMNIAGFQDAKTLVDGEVTMKDGQYTDPYLEAWRVYEEQVKKGVPKYMLRKPKSPRRMATGGFTTGDSNMALEWNPATGRPMETGASAPAVMPSGGAMASTISTPAIMPSATNARMLQPTTATPLPMPAPTTATPQGAMSATAQPMPISATNARMQLPTTATPQTNLGAFSGIQGGIAPPTASTMPMPAPTFATPQNMQRTTATDGRMPLTTATPQGAVSASAPPAMATTATPQSGMATTATDGRMQLPTATPQPMPAAQGNAYGKGGFQQANPMTQAANMRMTGAMGSTPQMGAYTSPNNFSAPPSYGGGKGGQMQQPAPPPSYSGGGKGGGYGYQRPQRSYYGGGKGG